jgi:hypothetical protein
MMLLHMPMDFCKSNLALKADVEYQEEEREEEEEVEEEGCPKDTKYAWIEHMVLTLRAFRGNKGMNFKLNLSRVNSSASNPKNNLSVKKCYNYGNSNHFVVECSYEKIEYNRGRLICKDKSKFSPRKNFV